MSTCEDDVQQCRSLQAEELEVVESIYPDYVSHDAAKGTDIIFLEIPVHLSDKHTVILTSDDTSTYATVASTSVQTVEHLLSDLPPILLQISFSQDYPLRSPPQIHSLHATHSWLPRQRAVVDDLLGMWQAGEGVLYSWIEHIESGRFMESLALVEDGNNIRIPHPAPQVMLPILKDYDIKSKAAAFNQTSYSCSVCITSVKGAKSILLSCQHVFCRECLEDFWKLCIAEGDVGRVGCPDPDCVKAGREAMEEEVRRVVTEEEVIRWKWLREKRMLEKDPTIIHCPVQICQTPVLAPPSQDPAQASGWDRLRTCPKCSYSFCAFCRRTWHGPITDCPLAVTDSFVDEYMALAEGSDKRRQLEQRYGKANLTRLAARRDEERANLKWLEDSTTSCPYCHVHVEKSMGCNHITCSKCSGHFCYRCGDKLTAGNPYGHFSTPGYACYSKLFDHVPEDDGWQPIEGFNYI